MPPRPNLKLNLAGSVGATAGATTEQGIIGVNNNNTDNSNGQGASNAMAVDQPGTVNGGGNSQVGDFQERLRLLSNGTSVVKPEDIELVHELGHGNGGTVHLVRHKQLGHIMARKVIQLDLSAAAIRGIYTELQILLKCESSHIVKCYGFYVDSGQVAIFMEYMDVGSLDKLYRLVGGFQEEYIGKIVVSVLSGLVYLYETHRLIHRDIKPSNILLNGEGQIKICDFGVSGELINSIANSFVGTSSYMAPERIEGKPYHVQSDVWSLGITLIELAMGRFPFPQPDGIFDLLTLIVNDPPPKLSTQHFSPEFVDFVDNCLIKDPSKRPSPSQLLQHPFAVHWRNEQLDTRGWAQELMSISKQQSG